MCFTAIIGRLYLISSGTELKKSGAAQRKYSLEVDESRAYIYDRNLKSMVNEEYSYTASVNPTPEIIAMLLNDNLADEDELLEKAQGNKPFKIKIKDDKIYSKDISVHKTLNRYRDGQLAPHIIGHLDYEGKGIMGVEHAYDDYLSGYGGKINDSFAVSAMGNTLDENISTENSGYNDKHGVVLTLDSDIQRITEKACRGRINKGAAVVMDVNSGEILASVSVPDFNPADIAADMQNPDKPFFNRAFAPNNMGSAFKIVVAACALENGIDFSKTYKCDGYVEVGDRKYHCQNIYGHGLLNMKDAMAKSCNPYFINLAQETGVRNICYKAMQLGLGSSVEIMPGHFTPKGKLPTFEELEDIGEATNFSFGQGMLTASPLQVCQMVSAVANGGMSVTPKLVIGFSQKGEKIDEYLPTYTGNQVIEKRAAIKVKELMKGVVENGSGKKAKPEKGGAGGKTSSAQTGILDENGEEIVHAWFTGFYPFENPKYAITVMCEGGNSGGDVCAPIFKEICDNITVVKGK